MCDDDLITVCAACQQATCWQGEFYCEAYKTANIKQMRRGDLAKLALEHPCYWLTDEELANKRRTERRRRCFTTTVKSLNVSRS